MSALPAASDLHRFYLCEALAVLELGGRSPALIEYARHALIDADRDDADRDFIYRAAVAFARHLEQQGTESAMAEARMLRAWILDAVTTN